MKFSIRELRLVRFAYAGQLIARILAGYRRIGAKRKKMTDEEYQRALSEYHTRSAERIYRGVIHLQGLMIKIGQTIGSRGDVFPEEYVRVLSRLQDQVPPRPFRIMRPHIERELRAKLEDIFSEFNQEPVAAASLAQVYRARLKDGREVAVKVVYPNIHRLVKTDLWILRALIWLDGFVNHYPLDPVHKELAANVPLETDMLHEADAMEEIAAKLAHRDDIVIPKTVREHVSKRVLTMEYIEGIKVTEIERIIAAGIDPNALFVLVAEIYLEQLLRHGHFHADPHPGNLFALPGNRLAILDFGLTKRFSEDFRKAFKLTTKSIFNGDNRGLMEGLKAGGFKLKNEADEAGYIANGEFFRAMSNPDTYKDKDVMNAVSDAWVNSFKKNRIVEMSGDFTLPMRVFGLLFGLGAVVGQHVEIDPNAVPKIALRYASEPDRTSPSLATA